MEVGAGRSPAGAGKLCLGLPKASGGSRLSLRLDCVQTSFL